MQIYRVKSCGHLIVFLMLNLMLHDIVYELLYWRLSKEDLNWVHKHHIKEHQNIVWILL